MGGIKHSDDVVDRISQMARQGMTKPAIAYEMTNSGYPMNRDMVKGVLDRAGISTNEVRRGLTVADIIQYDKPEPLNLGLQEIRNLYGGTAKARKQFSIRKDRVRVRIPAEQPICLCFVSDVHIGSPYCDTDKFIDDIEVILADPRIYLMAGGDWRDNFQPGFKDKSAVVNQVHPPQIQAISVDKLFDELNGKIVTAIGGNHDRFMNKQTGMDIEYFIHRNRPFPYMPYGGIVDITIGSIQYQLLWKHQTTNNSQENWFNAHHKLRQRLCTSADIVILEHLHRSGIEMLSQGGNDKIQRVLNIQTGTYKIEDPYAVEFFRPGEFGAQCIVFWPDRKKMVAFGGDEAILDAQTYLNGLQRNNGGKKQTVEPAKDPKPKKKRKGGRR